MANPKSYGITPEAKSIFAKPETIDCHLSMPGAKEFYCMINSHSPAKPSSNLFVATKIAIEPGTDADVDIVGKMTMITPKDIMCELRPEHLAIGGSTFRCWNHSVAPGDRAAWLKH